MTIEEWAKAQAETAIERGEQGRFLCLSNADDTVTTIRLDREVSLAFIVLVAGMVHPDGPHMAIVIESETHTIVTATDGIANVTAFSDGTWLTSIPQGALVLQSFNRFGSHSVAEWMDRPGRVLGAEVMS
jgi:hypothetical protein